LPIAPSRPITVLEDLWRSHEPGSFDFHGQSEILAKILAKILAIFSAIVLAIASAIVCHAHPRRLESAAHSRRTPCGGGVCCGRRRSVLSLYA
jgi:hypothetical protein